MAASGGYGDPLDRDAAAVADDVKQEKMTANHALREYGVIVSSETYEVDVGATARERAARRAGASSARPPNEQEKA